MKIAITLVIDVDPAEWALVYGSGPEPADVREDVRSYVLTTVQGSAGIEESEATVKMRP